MTKWPPLLAATAALFGTECSTNGTTQVLHVGSTGAPPEMTPPLSYDAQLSVSTLSFASVGDTRPTKTCKTTSSCDNPSQLVGRIYQQIQAHSRRRCLS